MLYCKDTCRLLAWPKVENDISRILTVSDNSCFVACCTTHQYDAPDPLKKLIGPRLKLLPGVSSRDLISLNWCCREVAKKN